MSRSIGLRSSVVPAALVLAAAYTAACRDGRAPRVDTAAGQVDFADSAPASAASVVAAVLTDENVFALLDTAYAAMIAVDRFAQRKTDGAVKDFAATAVSENSVTRRAIRSTAHRLNIAPVLPDRDVIGDQAQEMSDLRTRAGADLDRAYLDRAIEVRKDLMDEIDDALENGGVRREPVRKFLSDVRVSLDASRKTAEDLRAKLD